MLRRLSLAISLAIASVSLHAATYTLEPNYTQGIVRWNHIGFSMPTGQFAQAQGTLEFDAENPTRSSVKVTIPVSSLHTGVPELDEHLRSADFFDAAKFPSITFNSTRLEKGAQANRFEVTGNLTVHGVTRPVTLDVRFLKSGTNPITEVPTVGFDATVTLKRSDFGLGKFVPLVGDEVELHITTQGAEAKAYAAYLKAQADEAAKESARK